MTWNSILHVGDIELTVALAAAIGAWLAAARAWRMALWWGLLFTVGIGLVSVNKVAFLAWGLTCHMLNFKAISGHASGVTAVFPVLFYLLLNQRGAHAQMAGVGAGLSLGALMALLLVAGHAHSAAEALAGWITGAAISLGTIRLGGTRQPLRARPYCLPCSMLVFAAAVGFMHALPHNSLMHRTAALIGRI